jgi:hypothetical protein
MGAKRLIKMCMIKETGGGRDKRIRGIKIIVEEGKE